MPLHPTKFVCIPFLASSALICWQHYSDGLGVGDVMLSCLYGCSRSTSEGYRQSSLLTPFRIDWLLLWRTMSMSAMFSMIRVCESWGFLEVRGWWPVRLAHAQSSLFGFLFWRAAGLRRLRFASNCHATNDCWCSRGTPHFQNFSFFSLWQCACRQGVSCRYLHLCGNWSSFIRLNVPDATFPCLLGTDRLVVSYRNVMNYDTPIPVYCMRPHDKDDVLRKERC